jgi:hypothetical protein
MQGLPCQSFSASTAPVPGHQTSSILVGIGGRLLHGQARVGHLLEEQRRHAVVSLPPRAPA